MTKSKETELREKILGIANKYAYDRPQSGLQAHAKRDKMVEDITSLLSLALEEKVKEVENMVLAIGVEYPHAEIDSETSRFDVYYRGVSAIKEKIIKHINR